MRHRPWRWSQYNSMDGPCSILGQTNLGTTQTTEPNRITSHASAVIRTLSTTQYGLEGGLHSTHVAPNIVMNNQKQSTLTIFEVTKGQCYKKRGSSNKILISYFQTFHLDHTRRQGRRANLKEIETQHIKEYHTCNYYMQYIGIDNCQYQFPCIHV